MNAMPTLKWMAYRSSPLVLSLSGLTAKSICAGPYRQEVLDAVADAGEDIIVDTKERDIKPIRTIVQLVNDGIFVP
jgi:hypothetical protein